MGGYIEVCSRVGTYNFMKCQNENFTAHNYVSMMIMMPSEKGIEQILNNSNSQQHKFPFLVENQVFKVSFWFSWVFRLRYIYWFVIWTREGFRFHVNMLPRFSEIFFMNLWFLQRSRYPLFILDNLGSALQSTIHCPTDCAIYYIEWMTGMLNRIII